MGAELELPGSMDEKNRLLGELVRRWVQEGNEVILKDKKGETRTMVINE